MTNISFTQTNLDKENSNKYLLKSNLRLISLNTAKPQSIKKSLSFSSMYAELFLSPNPQFLMLINIFRMCLKKV